MGLAAHSLMSAPGREITGVQMSRRIKIWSFADVDRSGKVRWVANELGYAIEEVRVELGQHRAKAYLELNPFGQIPTAEIDGKLLIESTAICLALAERHPDSGLVPEKQPSRDTFWQMLNLAVSTLETPVVLYYLSLRGVVNEAWSPLCEEAIGARLSVFAAGMPEEGYICGEFTLADVCAAYVLRIGVQAQLLSLEGGLKRYLHRLMDRPAAQEARFFRGL